MRKEMLRVERLNAWYGESHVLHGIGFHVNEGELVTLLGRNGAGRSSTLRAIMGIGCTRKGSIRVQGHETTSLKPHHIARLGIGYCPEERGIYASLNVEENLLLLPKVGPDGMTLAEIYQMFPNLYERRKSQGTKLSGGEQQMLAMARILRTGAKLLLLDEITEGLAPVVVEMLGKVLKELKSRGYTIVLVEQNFRFSAPLADRNYVVEHGNIVATVAHGELEKNRTLIENYLGV